MEHNLIHDQYIVSVIVHHFVAKLCPNILKCLFSFDIKKQNILKCLHCRDIYVTVYFLFLQAMQ